MRHTLPTLGSGIGLRRAHFSSLLETPSRLDWLEFIPENYMAYGGRPGQALEAVRERWPLVAHGVALNLGGTAPLDQDYLLRLKRILERVDSPWFSDHLCFTGVPHRNTYELLPLPLTREALAHVVARIRAVRATIDRPLLIENISYYVQLPGGEMLEHEFMSEVLEQADCGLLLDINNVYVNSRNHDFDPDEYLKKLPLERVVQVHLAGHDDSGPVVVDTHGAPIRDEVWQLFDRALRLLGPVSVLIERDHNIPALEVLIEEAAHARALLQAEIDRRCAHPPCVAGSAVRGGEHEPG